MQRKDILELKKRFKKDECTFTNISGCYVNGKKETVLKFNEAFLNLDDDEFYKYLEIAKKVLSGTIGNSLLEINFSNSNKDSLNIQNSLIQLKKSKLKDENLLNEFYESIISKYDYPENYIILVFHDVYDVMTKTSDNLEIDESEEVYEYIICAICPITLSAPGLSYYEDENTIKARSRDWVVGAPVNGFVYPGFIDRSTDVNSIIYYTKNAKDIHPELITKILGCSYKETIKLQQEKFQSIVKDSISDDKEEAEDIYMDIQENLHDLVEYEKSIAPLASEEPIELTKDKLQEVLMDSGIPEENINKVEEFYIENFDTSLPSAEDLIDKKIIKLNEQRKKEKHLQKEVQTLREQLENNNPIDDLNSEYDVIIKAKSDRVADIKTELIDGQEYIMIPVKEEDKTIIDEL